MLSIVLRTVFGLRLATFSRVLEHAEKLTHCLILVIIFFVTISVWVLHQVRLYSSIIVSGTAELTSLGLQVRGKIIAVFVRWIFRLIRFRGL